jgi:predicted Rossmann fold nucleotide-binding protein DprA/Smf involved in DNA uptake
MTSPLSPNTEAILLLTAPLIAGKGKPSSDLLTASEYTKLVSHLQKNHLEPADLVSRNGAEALRSCGQVIDVERLERLLGRGFLLAQALDGWQARAIWVLSRADPQYPRILKSRLKSDAPSVLYGCGDASALSSGGLAVVGSRHVDDDLVQYTQEIGALAAQSGRPIVSGGAKGIDQAAMHGALDAGGRAVGVLADSLEKSVLARYNRDMLLSKQLTLVSPYDPAAGFNVGNAMRRNKFIYALSNAALVVSSDVDKGGTWNGAVEQLTKLKLVPVYVRSTGPESAGLKALVGKGARCWPNPVGVEGFRAFLAIAADAVEDTQPGLPFSEADAGNGDEHRELPNSRPAAAITAGATAEETANPLQDKLFDTVRTLIRDLAADPTHVPDVASALAVTDKQAALWVARLLEEHVLVEGPGENSFIAPDRP